MLSFPRAPIVAVGDRITSSQLSALADAFRARIRSGPGDSAQRLFYWWLNAFRQLRTGDGLQMPSQGEFFHLYQHLDPKYSTAQYPLNDPDVEEGANTANILAQFHFGVHDEDGAAIVPSEEERINDPIVPLWFGAQPPSTPFEIWELGKIQRGAINIATGEGNTPALSAALSPFFLQMPFFSPHGKGFGGFFPSPIVLANSCGADESGGLNIPSFEIKFTALSKTASIPSNHGSISTNSDGYAVVTYSGSCPSWTDDTAPGHVWTIIRAPNAYYVLVNPGEWDVYPLNDWLEGPYTGNGRLYRYDAGHIGHMLSETVKTFRGTPGQRSPDTYHIRDIAFDNQAFFTGQYRLSPARGLANGAGIEPIYPAATFAGSEAEDGAILNWGQWGDRYHRFEGYVICGSFVFASGLFEPCVVDLIDETGAILQTLSLTPNEDGDAESMAWFDASKPLYVQARVTNGAKFTGADGGLRLEIAELAEYKPEERDAYLVLRLSATQGGQFDQESLDGAGIDCPTAKEIYESYAQNGCILNGQAAGIRSTGAAINTSPAYEAFRALSREMVKLVRRQEFISYEVSGGKSILRFRRWAFGLFNERADLWYGMAPDFEPASEIIEGEVYIIRATSGAVTYRGAQFTHGQKFIGADGYSDFETAGDAQLFVYDGIRAIARKRGLTNTWCGRMDTHFYHQSESSIFKPEAYADYFPANDRCLTYASPVPEELHRHIDPNYGISVEPRADGTGYDLVNTGLNMGQIPVSPESVTGYRYALGMNSSAGSDDDFCKSCRIFEPPWQVESCVVEPDMTNGGRDDIVKITISGRIHSHDDAPASVDPNPLNWSDADIAALQAESYRTDDNALREYALYMAKGIHASWKVGDAARLQYPSATTGGVQSLPDNPHGSVFPKFQFVREPESPWEDGNDTRELTDARLNVDVLRKMEIWLKAMCEGFVNGESSRAAICADNFYPYDFFAEDLYQQAFGGRSIGAMALSLRNDNPVGYGPLPNTTPTADVFNRVASAVNLLTQVRVDIPMVLQNQITTETGEQSVGSGCAEGSGLAFTYSGPTPPLGSPSVGPWTDGIANAVAFGGLSTEDGAYCMPDGSGGYRFTSFRSSVRLRYNTNPLSTSFQYAIPSDLWNLLQGGEIALFGDAERLWFYPFSFSVPAPDGEDCLVIGTPYFIGTRWSYRNVTEDLGCLDVTSINITGGTAPGGDFYMGSQSDSSSPPYSACGNQSEQDLNINSLAASGSIPIAKIPLT